MPERDEPTRAETAHPDRPRFAVSEYTTPTLTFAQDLAIFGAEGCEGIGLVPNKVGSPVEDLAALRQSGLAASSMYAGNILPGAADRLTDHEERVGEIEEVIRRVAPFSPSCVFVVTGQRGELEPETARDRVIDALRRAAAAAAEHGIVVGLEPVHPSLRQFSFVSTIPEGIELLDRAGAENLRIVLDMWHVGEGPHVVSDAGEHAARIAAVHLNDRRVPTRHWCDRVLPGDGSVDVPGILSALRDGGFAGWIELEVASDDGRIANDFPDSLWKWPPELLVRAGRERFLELWPAA